MNILNEHTLVLFYPNRDSKLSKAMQTHIPQIGDMYQVVDTIYSQDEYGAPFVYVDMLQLTDGDE